MTTPKMDPINNEILDLAFESIDASFGYIEYITSQTGKTIGLFSRNFEGKAYETLDDVLELMDLYIQLVTKIYSTLRSERIEIGFKNDEIKATELHLITINKALRMAREKKDKIVVCDLLEDELLANLNEWKTLILPELQKLRPY